MEKLRDVIWRPIRNDTPIIDPPAVFSEPSPAPQPPIWHCMLAGLIGGAVGDSLMHSLDTVKTRQQAAPNIPEYRNTLRAYRTLLVKEGFRKGLYGGYGAAMLGSIPSGAIFFGTYEGIKRLFINDFGLNDTVTHLAAGFLGDLMTSFVYVPLEVLKTRMQLQGRYNNPHFKSAYNYKGLVDAVTTILAHEGWRTFFYGYKATLCRDLPFSALQFAFYEKFRELGFRIQGSSKELSLGLEIATGAAAGGIAGVLTTPLDVFKTRLQTQLAGSSSSPPSATGHSGSPAVTAGAEGSKSGVRPYTTAPSTARPAILRTLLVVKGLYIVYRTEGIVGLFSGVQARFVWTSVQSSVMLLLYQQTLKELSKIDFNQHKLQ